MMRRGILHPELAALLAACGHLDEICVADAGLPIPPEMPRVDLAYAPGRAPFIDVVEVILGEMVFERALVAEEAATRSPEMLARLRGILGAVACESAPHEEFKNRVTRARLVVRTGEFTPYANLLLRCGVPF